SLDATKNGRAIVPGPSSAFALGSPDATAQYKPGARRGARTVARGMESTVPESGAAAAQARPWTSSMSTYAVERTLGATTSSSGDAWGEPRAGATSCIAPGDTKSAPAHEPVAPSRDCAWSSSATAYPSGVNVRCAQPRESVDAAPAAPERLA